MVISIYKFLLTYYGIALDAGTICSHKQLKKEFNFLKGCSFKYANSNLDMVGDGRIIYVSDSFGKIVPYFSPEEIRVSNIDCNYIEIDDDINVDFGDIGSVPTYVLGKLLSQNKHRPSVYRIIKNELINRGVYQNKIYKIEKEIESISYEESENNDKYKRRRKIKCNQS